MVDPQPCLGSGNLLRRRLGHYWIRIQLWRVFNCMGGCVCDSLGKPDVRLLPILLKIWIGKQQNRTEREQRILKLFRMAVFLASDLTFRFLNWHILGLFFKPISMN